MKSQLISTMLLGLLLSEMTACGGFDCELGDGVKNGSETGIDCGSACGTMNLCAADQECLVDEDCAEGLSCVDSGTCQIPGCFDGTINGDETDIDCGGIMCGTACSPGLHCLEDSDCSSESCIDNTCAAARNCLDWLFGGFTADGVYEVDPDGADEPMRPYDVYCDMTTGGGGWTLLLKTTGDDELNYTSPYWESDQLLNEQMLSPDPGNAKLEAYMFSPITQMRGCFPEQDEHCIVQAFQQPQTALEVFSGPEQLLTSYGGQFSSTWSTEPSCQQFGVNNATLECNYQVRFGFVAAEESHCQENKTAIGFGIGTCNEDVTNQIEMGGGMICGNDNQSYCPKPAQTPTETPGLLWGRDQSFCWDGLKNGDETDVDCGGAICGACRPGGQCLLARDCQSGHCTQDETCDVHPYSCKEIVDNGQATEDGMYLLDPDGPGGEQPFSVYCDMNTDGGGWILVASNYANDGKFPRGAERHKDGHQFLLDKPGQGDNASTHADYLIGKNIFKFTFSEARIFADRYDDGAAVVDVKWPQGCYLCSVPEVTDLCETLSDNHNIDTYEPDYCHIDGLYMDTPDPKKPSPSVPTIGGLCTVENIEPKTDNTVLGLGATEETWPGEGVSYLRDGIYQATNFMVYTTWIR